MSRIEFHHDPEVQVKRRKIKDISTGSTFIEVSEGGGIWMKVRDRSDPLKILAVNMNFGVLKTYPGDEEVIPVKCDLTWRIV